MSEFSRIQLHSHWLAGLGSRNLRRLVSLRLMRGSQRGAEKLNRYLLFMISVSSFNTAAASWGKADVSELQKFTVPDTPSSFTG